MAAKDGQVESFLTSRFKSKSSKSKPIHLFTEINDEINYPLEKVASLVLEREFQSLSGEMGHDKENLREVIDPNSPWKMVFGTSTSSMKVKMSLPQPVGEFSMTNNIPQLTSTIVGIDYFGDGNFSITVNIMSNLARFHYCRQLSCHA